MREITDKMISYLENIEGNLTNYPGAIENWRNWSDGQDLCPIDFSTPTNAQNVSARIEQINKYMDFSKQQTKVETVLPIFASAPNLATVNGVLVNACNMAFVPAPYSFLEALQRYENSEFEYGDIFLVSGFKS